MYKRGDDPELEKLIKEVQREALRRQSKESKPKKPG